MKIEIVLKLFYKNCLTSASVLIKMLVLLD